ncbi:MAG TPA: phosphatidylserine/phosphatidylglycerophosphate/cardiolipin synthase family protein [Steroidobacteraceae bacterium]|jgi:phosphatidylserine/phosphatidylglycerophosphate/cardiolipin synthase-like enzyme|nr:phosphatidylserine/phosphatidylglycerophosphate/cardiolipin synthase family protein [Steroidobacteraceae bacterium]
MADPQNTGQFTGGSWPWRSGNHFQLLDDNERFFERMLQTIESATAYVLLEMYLVESGIIAGRFVEALGRAARRGVRVCVIFDGFGSLGLGAAYRRTLIEAGVELRTFNPIALRARLQNFLRDHRKLLLVDGNTAFTGGAGLTDEFAIPGPPGQPWRDLMVEITGPVVADWQRAFDRTWRRSGAELGLAVPSEFPPLAEGADGRVSLSEARARSMLANGVVRRIQLARARAWIMSAYFVPSRRFRKALRGAARRGVDVRLLVPGPRTDHPWVRQAARRFYGKMLRSGVRIFEYQPRMLHAKLIISDDWVSIGSSNLDRWSFKWNLEANQEVQNAAFAAIAAAVFEGDCAQSEILSRRSWPQRAWIGRLQERIAGVLERMLDRWRRPRIP